MPFEKMNVWLQKEQQLHSPNPYNIVLSTSTDDGTVHSRIVAIREISVSGILFFTQKCSRKVKEIINHPNASMTLWLPLQQRQINLEGSVYLLPESENLVYWQQLERQQQLKFSAYAPLSGKVITSKEILDERYQKLKEQFKDQSIPMSEYYIGARFVPHTFCFYTLRKDEFSDVLKYSFESDAWCRERLSP